DTLEANDQDKLLLASSNNQSRGTGRGKNFNKEAKESMKWKNSPNARGTIYANLFLQFCYKKLFVLVPFIPNPGPEELYKPMKSDNIQTVDDFKQLEFLAGSREWFGRGSRILITARDEHLLSYAQEKYSPELLNQTEAMTLFSRYAFRENIPPNEFKELLGAILSSTGYLPLALKVLGSHFLVEI
ncbi:TMV resistance protein N-like protein, partial [Tanacetum coccineum]